MICLNCDKPFKPTTFKNYCCLDCALAYQDRVKKAYRMVSRANEAMPKPCYSASQGVKLHEIMTAKKKPEGCSEIRWKMELKRRQMHPGWHPDPAFIRSCKISPLCH